MSTGEDIRVNSAEAGPPDGVNPYMVRTPESPREHEFTTEAKRTYTKPLVRPRNAFDAPAPGWIRWMSWDTISAGDCRMEDAIVYLYPDAQIYFSAYTITSSSGDVWIVRGITFYDASGDQIGQPVGQHDGQNMAWEDSYYPFAFWDTIPGVGAESVTQITSATLTNHC
jgi:hypothetical protein